jgi:hypothetical protein
MKMVKSLLLGSAAGLVAITGAQAKPVEYVKICSLYGEGFYYIPGTDTCLKLGGYVRAEVNINAGGSYGVPTPSGGSPPGLYLDNRNAFLQDWRTRAGFSIDTRSQTAYGTLRSYMFITSTDDNSGVNSANAAPANLSGASGYTRIYAPTAFIQFAGFTAGKTDSFFTFDTNPYTNSSAWWSNAQGGNGVQLFAYTAQFGNGISASVSVENADAHRMGIASGAAFAVIAPAAANPGLWKIDAAPQAISYGNQNWPDFVGNVRIDQGWGSAQIMGALHQVRASDLAGVAGTAPSDKTGYAIGAGLKFNLPMLGAGDYIQGQVTYAKGIMDHVASNSASSLSVTDGFPWNQVALAPTWDAVLVGGATGSLHLTRGWSFTLGYEHRWTSQWKTSLWGQYGKIDYDNAAGAVLAAGLGGASTDADYSMWSIGSRTVWTPVANLDLSIEVMYQKLNTAFDGNTIDSILLPVLPGGPRPIRDQDWWSGIFRVQRNFWP